MTLDDVLSKYIFTDNSDPYPVDQPDPSNNVDPLERLLIKSAIEAMFSSATGKAVLERMLANGDEIRFTADENIGNRSFGSEQRVNFNIGGYANQTAAMARVNVLV